MTSHWPRLPVEIYIHILSFVTPTRLHDVALKTLLSCLCANSQVRTAALAPSVWEAVYRRRYTHCVGENERARREAMGGDWRLMYLARRALDRRALQLVDGIRQQVEGRHTRARVLAQELSFDVWDALELETQIPLPPYLRTDEEGDLDDDPVPHALPRRYWARTVMGVIARYYTMMLWRSNTHGFEQTLAGLSAFFDESPIQISVELDNLTAHCRQDLLDAGVELDPHSPTYDLSEICVRIREHLRSIGFESASGTDWYDVLIQFPHAFVSEGPWRKTLPMSLVYVFVAIARRLGVQASPTNFPRKVLCHIAPADPAAPEMLFDMCSDSRPFAFSSRDPVRMLADVGMPANTPEDYVRPCTMATLMHRVASNIIMSVRWHHRGGATITGQIPVWASYAASCIFLLHAPDLRLFPRVMDWKPLDVVAILQDAICPALTPDMRSPLISMCTTQLESERELGSVVWLRDEVDIKYFNGLIVEHVDSGVVGCIRAWHPKCLAMGDISAILEHASFTHGWDQPFYCVLTTHGCDRYVPQEKLRPLPMSQSVVRQLFDRLALFGRYFEDVDIGEHGGRLLMTEEVKCMYPEDDAVGALWTAQGNLESDSSADARCV